MAPAAKINKIDAKRLAELHHAVMTMVTTRSGFQINVMTTPRKALQDYIATVDRLDIVMYNEHFLADAWACVEAIEAKQTAVAKAAFGGESGR